MLIKIGTEIVDTNTTPVALVFYDEQEAKDLAQILQSIKSGDTEHPSEFKWWMMHPSSMTKQEVDQWSVLSEEEKLKMGRLNLKPKFEL